jgi:osmoprotectant transport system permease protein
LLFDSLLNGEIDAYPEYTGTLTKEIYAHQEITSDDQLREVLARQGVRMSRPLGFNNTYALGMLRPRAEQLQIRTTSDLLRHPDLKFGFSNEFMDRGDGWPSLKKRYGLPQTEVRGLDHDLAYQQLGLGVIDVVDVYTTDARIQLMELAILEDDLAFFPRYDAVLLYRDDLRARYPDAVAAILRLEGRINESAMVAMNGRAEVDRVSESQISADFLADTLNVTVAVAEETVTRRLIATTIEHLDLVRRSLIPAILVAIPLGIWAAKRPRAGQCILSLVGLVQTIPALALLVILMPVIVGVENMLNLGLVSIGTGSATAITALFLYSLLPIVRNTHAGLRQIAPDHLEASAALGLSPWYRLNRIELPLASAGILAGIKTAAVINVGFATLGALIGAGGYGQPILTGIRLADTGLILQGAIPAAALALLVQGAFDVSERFLVPRGLRLQRAAD